MTKAQEQSRRQTAFDGESGQRWDLQAGICRVLTYRLVVEVVGQPRYRLQACVRRLYVQEILYMVSTGLDQQLSPFRVESAHSRNVSAEMTFAHEPLDDCLLQRWRLTAGNDAGVDEKLDNRFWDNQIGQS